MARTSVRLRIEGGVQGVGYRWWALGEARRLQVRGWVRNRRDGSVELLAIGAPEAVGQLLIACRRGPAPARVTSIDRSDAEDDGSPGFDERPTA